MVSPADPAPARSNPDPPESERHAVRVEILIVLVVTFGLSAAGAALALAESALAPGGIGGQTVALNRSRAAQSTIDLLYQLLSVLRLTGWAALGLYLLQRSGTAPRAIGLARVRWHGDMLPALALALVIGLPGLGLYLIAHRLGMSVTIVPSSLAEHWWRLPVLILSALANATAEEILVVGYLLTRLRELGWSANRSLLVSALLRGSYHLYQGVGGGLGNVVMGGVFGRYWQRTNRLWPLLLAHAIIDTTAYVGYVAVRGHLSWLP